MAVENWSDDCQTIDWPEPNRFGSRSRYEGHGHRRGLYAALRKVESRNGPQALISGVLVQSVPNRSTTNHAC